MTHLLPLVRAGLRTNFGVAVARHRLFVEKKDGWLLPLIGVSLLGLVPLLYGFARLIHNVYLALERIGQQHALLTLGVMSGQLFILLFGLYYVIAAFYFYSQYTL